jgi:hypothetical protein
MNVMNRKNIPEEDPCTVTLNSSCCFWKRSFLADAAVMKIVFQQNGEKYQDITTIPNYQELRSHVILV